MAEKRNSIVLRFGILYFGIVLLFFAVVLRVLYIQTVEGKEWMKVASRVKKSNMTVKPTRGNIFASDGRLMASTIPTYYIYMDTRVPSLRNDNNKLFYQKVDSVAQALSVFFGDRSKLQYKTMLLKAFSTKRGEQLLYPGRITYAQLKAVRKMPLFNMGRIKSGLITKEMLRREKPFGSLASRTIGDIFADENRGGKNGLELFFNSELYGTPGISVYRKVANRLEETVELEPINGMDIVSTIDIEMQDIAEKALKDSLKAFNASMGYAVVMEVKTGEIKAIANMYQRADGSYYEQKNGAVSDQVESGSTFKIFSLMALLDEGKADTSDIMHTGNGTYEFAGRIMRDHNSRKGGYKSINLAEVIHASSNVGISMAVQNAWGSNPSGFVDKLYEMGMNEKFDLEIPGHAGPIIHHPKDKARFWSATKLPWMSIGYESQIPPIYTLAYYNAIANNGKLIKPIFAKAIMHNGQVVKTFETEVIRKQICKPGTLKKIHEVLLGVVEAPLGTAKNVKSKYVRIAGKTGTAQISKGAEGYKVGGTSYQVTFCGYFPADDPLYSCIVVIREPKIGIASGGKMAGSVFKSIAEQVMAIKSNLKPESLLADTTQKVFPFFPTAKTGYSKTTRTVLNHFNLSLQGSNANWIQVETNEQGVAAIPITVNNRQVPNLKGMGAKDAMYLLGQLGLRVQLYGRGKVVSQNIAAGTLARKGDFIQIKLSDEQM